MQNKIMWLIDIFVKSVIFVCKRFADFVNVNPRRRLPAIIAICILLSIIFFAWPSGSKDDEYAEYVDIRATILAINYDNLTHDAALSIINNLKSKLDAEGLEFDYKEFFRTVLTLDNKKPTRRDLEWFCFLYFKSKKENRPHKDWDEAVRLLVAEANKDREKLVAINDVKYKRRTGPYGLLDVPWKVNVTNRDRIGHNCRVTIQFIDKDEMEVCSDSAKVFIASGESKIATGVVSVSRKQYKVIANALAVAKLEY